MLVKSKLPELSRSMVYRIPRYHGEHISKICPIWELLPKDVNNPPKIPKSDPCAMSECARSLQFQADCLGDNKSTQTTFDGR